MTSSLYDSPAEIVTKAMRVHEIPAGELALCAELDREALERFRQGDFEPAVARRLAPVLGLDPDAFTVRGEPYPRPALPRDIERLVLPFEDEHVNAWLITDGPVPLVIDAGFGPHDLERELDRRGVGEIDLLVTHPHRDHIGGLDALRSRLHHLALPGRRTRPGGRIQLGHRRIRILDLRGHHPEAVGFLLDDREVPLVAVGDAVFAGSIGGCPDPSAFALARQTILDSLFPLPPASLLLPGHGPATTLGTELERNPFLAAWHAPPVR